MDIFSFLVVEVQLWIVSIITKAFTKLSWNCIVCISEANEQSFGNSWAQADTVLDIQILLFLRSLLTFPSLVRIYVCMPVITNTHRCVCILCLCLYACRCVGHKRSILAIESFPSNLFSICQSNFFFFFFFFF